MEKEFHCLAYLKTLSNIHELLLLVYCNLLKKIKEASLIHRFRIFRAYGSSFILFSNPMLKGGSPGDICEELVT